ncbi:hypothetical protein OU798_15545 [Prolixibacteraceae bacterium Z1-6]|uniref:Tetratricopeptide repeat protein n=1 Tax=Draconibacterium aestuarii TaxID=2998507 RepID=A0A9X3J6S8_9BACT|nr:hypothetical protein [Prolixibacteraceae bacterium Z1-6]
MRTVFLITFLILAIAGKASEKDSLVNRIFNLAYNQQYEAAETLLQKNKTNIDALYFAVLEIDMSYWKNVTGTHDPNYKAFENTLSLYETESPETFNQKGIQLIQLSYKLRYELKRFKLIDAVFTHNKTTTLFGQLKTDSEMQNVGDPELFQLYNAMFLYFSNYLKPFGGKSKKESCKQALQEIESLANSENLVTKTIASYSLGRTYLKYEDAPEKGISYFRILAELYPGNKKFPELIGECEEKLK